MDVLVTEVLLEILMISITFSIILMALIQKFKDLKFINKGWHTWLLNLILAFLVGIPFAMIFYKLDITLAIWVSIFGFIGAPTIYQVLKEQNIINYTPKSTDNNLNENDNTITIPKENEIKRN